MAISPAAKRSLLIVGLLYAITVGALLVTLLSDRGLDDEYAAESMMLKHLQAAQAELRATFNEQEGDQETGPISTKPLTEGQAAEIISKYMRGQGEIIGVNATLLMQIANFLVLLVLLYAFLWNPLLDFLDQRRQAIKSRLDDAEENRKNAEQVMRERQGELDELRRERADILEQARSMGEQEGDQIVERARREAHRLMEQTEERLGEQVRASREKLRAEVAELATEIAARILRREISDEDHDAIVERMIQDMEKPEPGGDA